MSESLQVPFFLPNGMTLFQDANFMTRLHNGDPTYGWVGDERLGVYHAGGRIEIWRHCEDGVPRLIVRSKPGVNVLDGGLLRFLAEHDSMSRRAYNVRADMDAANAAVQRELDRKAQEQTEEAAERLEHGLRKDIGAHIGVTSKRFF